MTSASNEQAQRERDKRLMGAISKGAASGVARALSQGASPNATDPSDPSLRAVEAALIFGFGPGKSEGLAIMRLLLKAGADPRQSALLSDEFYSALGIAATRLEAPVEALALLVEAGADPNEKDAFGRSPLSYAAEEGRVEKAMELLRLGAELGAKDEAGETAEGAARRAGKLEAALALAGERARREAVEIGQGLGGGRAGAPARL